MFWRLYSTLLACVMLSIILCASISSAHRSYNVLWIYPSPVSRFDFSFLLDRARAHLDRTMEQRNVSLISGYIEVDSFGDCPKLLEEALTKGLQGNPYDLVIGGGSPFGPCLNGFYNDSRWPEMKYFIIGSGAPKERLGVATLDSYHTAYIHGYICASVTKSGVIGYIISTRARSGKSVSAFVLGARHVNPDITVTLGIINDVNGLESGRKAAETIAKDNGVDCLGNQISSMGPSIAMQQLGLFSNGYGVDARVWSDDPNVLASSVWNLRPVVLPVYEMLVNDSWPPSWKVDANFMTGGVEVTSLSPAAPLHLGRELSDLKNSILNGSNRIFCGPDWANTEYGITENMEYTPEGQYCMKEAAAKTMKNFPSDFAVIGVEYHDAMDPFELKFIHSDGTAAIILYVITTCVLIGMSINFIHILIYRKHPTYVAASPWFLLIALGGIMLTMVSHYFRVGIPTNLRCMARFWFLGIGFSIATACITARLWRVWKTHASTSLRGVRIQVTTLIPKFLAVFVGFELLVLLIFTLLDPLHPLVFSSPSLEYDEMEVVCFSLRAKGERFGFLMWSTATSIMMVPIAVMVFLGRRAKREYTDSIPTIVLIYYLVGVILLSIIGVLTPQTYLTRFGLEYITMVASVGIWVALIVPKIYATYKSVPSEQSSALALASFSAPQFSSHVHRSSVMHHSNNQAASVVENPSIRAPSESE